MLQQVQASRKALDAVIETIPAGVVVSDGQGRITLANAAATDILGTVAAGNAFDPTRSYRLKRRDGTAIPVHDLPLPRAIERGERSTNVEIRVRPEAGTERAILAAASPILNSEGNVVNAVAIFQDITERIRVEDALRVSEESLARAQEVAHLGNWDRDLRTGRLHWSAEIYRIFGSAPEEFGGTLEDFLQCVHPDDRERVTKTIEKGLVVGRPYSFDNRIIRPDGEVRVVHNEVKVIRDEAGRAVQAVGTVQDITERKRVEEERERLLQRVQVERARVEAILNSTANAIIYVDAASTSLQANPAAVQLFGHPFESEGGLAQYVRQLLHPDGRPVTLDEVPLPRVLRGETTQQMELLVAQPDGDRIPVLESAAPVCDPEGHVIGAVVVFQDISPLKEIDRLREEWTSIVAHDLRQPVTVITGYAGLLGMKSMALPVEHRELDHILTAATNLSRMIEDLLDVSRIEARRLVLQLQSVDLAALVSGVVERLAAVTTGHPVQIDVERPVARVLVDPARIEQVLGNLLSNAAKYSYPNSEITVRVCQRDGEVLVSVINRGHGIPAEEAPRLFTRFYRTDEAQGGRAPGLGLGLYISKGIVEAHHGKIWVESIPGQTTTFTISLPVNDESNHDRAMIGHDVTGKT